MIVAWCILFGRWRGPRHPVRDTVRAEPERPS